MKIDIAIYYIILLMTAINRIKVNTHYLCVKNFNGKACNGSRKQYIDYYYMAKRMMFVLENTLDLPQ